MKLIVTHISPDLDAIASSWLVKRYLPGWESAEHAFVPAGETYEGKDPDENPEIIHVDTGRGRFDHHQFRERLSATLRVFEFLVAEKHIKKKDLPAISEMVTFITEIDNFGEVRFPEPAHIRYNFCLHEFIYPLRGQLSSDHELMYMTILILDSILFTVKNSLKAEEEMKTGAIIQTSLGKTLIMETRNEAAVKYALKKGYDLVVRRDPENGSIRIKTQPDDRFDLSKLSEIIMREDPDATWFLHESKNMLLNGSSKNPNSIPSKLSLARLIAILRRV